MNGDQEGNRLLKILENACLIQIVTQITRENYVLYLVLVIDSDFARECQVGENSSGCDHNLIRLTIRDDHKLTESMSKIPENRRTNFNLPNELLRWCSGSTLGSQPREPGFSSQAEQKILSGFSDTPTLLFTKL